MWTTYNSPYESLSFGYHAILWWWHASFKKDLFQSRLPELWDGDNFRTYCSNKHLKHIYLPEKHFNFKRLAASFLGFTKYVHTKSTVKRYSRRFFWFWGNAIKCYLRSHCSSRVMQLLCEHLWNASLWT